MLLDSIVLSTFFLLISTGLVFVFENGLIVDLINLNTCTWGE